MILPKNFRDYVYGVTIPTYNGEMKTITITITEELDQRAVAEARRSGVSKSELIRRGLEAVLPPEPAAVSDPWRDLSGFGSAGVRADPTEVDDVIYAR